MVGIRGSSQPETWLVLHQLQKLALAHHRVVQIQPRELDLLRPGVLERVAEFADEPVVQRPVILELERAQRVRDALNRVRQRMREVVHRIDAPRVAGPMMRGVPDAIERRVAHVEIRRRHVDLRAQDVRAVLELARAHPGEEVEVFVDRTVPVRTVLAGLGQRAPVPSDLLGREAVDVGAAARDQLDARTRYSRSK